MMTAVMHDHGDRGMVVMDGRRVVAKAHKAHGVWILRIYAGCWVDAMTNEAKAAQNKRFGLARSTSPEFKTVDTKREARQHLDDLVKQNQRRSA
jgi:hypothetical protein